MATVAAARETHVLDLDCDVWVRILDGVDVNDHFSFKLVSTQFKKLFKEARGGTETKTKTSYASAYGSIEKFKWAYSLGGNKGRLCRVSLACAAASSDLDLQVLKLAKSMLFRVKVVDVVSEVGVAAAAKGKVDVINWACEVRRDILSTAMFCAASGGGHTNALEVLRERGCPRDATACAAAAELSLIHI